jgi:hypothetical protein
VVPVREEALVSPRSKGRKDVVSSVGLGDTLLGCALLSRLPCVPYSMVCFSPSNSQIRPVKANKSRKDAGSLDLRDRGGADGSVEGQLPGV